MKCFFFAKTNCMPIIHQPLADIYYNILVVSQKNSEQVTEHRCNVLEVLEKFLKGTSY